VTKPLETIEKAVSSDRLTPYRVMCSGDLNAAVALYEWNATVSGALWVDIGHAEVLIRNAMHDQLTEWCAGLFGESRWYLNPGRILTFRHAADIAAARGRLKRSGKPATAGRIVAELNFGFWRYLMASHYELSLWRPCLYKSFPGQGKRRQLYDKLTDLHDARNRVAHHEPIYRSQLSKLHEDLLTVIEWINPALRQWVQRRSTVQAILAQRPHG
jgi:hypothetical protein